MSKASEYKEHSDKIQTVFDPDNDRKISARILTSGNLSIDLDRPESIYLWEGIKPDIALTLGQWIVDMYGEEKLITEAPLPVSSAMPEDKEYKEYQSMNFTRYALKNCLKHWASRPYAEASWTERVDATVDAIFEAMYHG